MYRMLFAIVLAVLVAACGDDAPTAPPATSSVSVTVSSPIRMGQTTQASGTAMLSNGQNQPITSGWLSDTPSVATVSDAGLVTGVANGLANIYVVSGGRQGQQSVRTVPDYQGTWNGGLRVTTCTQTATFATVNFCGDFPVGLVDGYTLSLAQSGEQLTAKLGYGPAIPFPSVATPIAANGTSSFATLFVDISSGLTIDASVVMNSLRVGELTGTVNEVWRVPGISGEGRLAQDIVGTVRTSTTASSDSGSEGGVAGKLRVLDRLAPRRR